MAVALAEWNAKLKKQIEDISASMEDDDEFWELVIFIGPFAIQNIVGTQLRSKHGRSRAGRSANRKRNRVEGHARLWQDYFAPNPTYGELLFRRRNRMSSRLFARILDGVCAHDPYFVQKEDATGALGLSPHQKITSALRQLAYGIAADATDEYYRIGESTALDSLYRFCKAIRELYESQYLRKPSAADFKKQLAINQERGFPGMFGSLDCMHWEWKNCPVAWQGQFTAKGRVKSLILEAIADQELWIWHTFFGLAGGNNDLNVLDRSPLLNDWLLGESANVNFQVNGTEYKRAYLLGDGIYPEWSIFIKSVHLPQTEKLKHFARCQEGARKDVEKAFGVLQARFHIVKKPARSWYEGNLVNILRACVVLHNMIIEDERGEDFPLYFIVMPPVVQRNNLPWAEFLNQTAEINNREGHFQLRADLIEHLWARKGEGIVDHV